MRVLVTGADGFVGRHLCAHLQACRDDVVAPGGPREGAGEDEFRLDVTRPQDVRALVERVRPEGVIHLAGLSSVGKSHQAPAAYFQVNALGTVHLLAALKEAAPQARVLLVGSGEMYGALPPDVAATEDMPLRPLSPYAASKVAAEVAGLQFHASYGLQVISVRPFNHLGAGQDANFVVPSFAAQLQAIARGASEPLLRVGNLEPIRDFSHVKDVVAAYRLLLEAGEPGQAYNICSGEGRSIRSLLDELLRLSSVHAQVEVDPARVRPVELPSLVGNPARLRRLGWAPCHTVSEALQDALAEHAQCG